MIVHIIRDDKFTGDFISFITRNFPDNVIVVYSKQLYEEGESFNQKVVNVGYSVKGLITFLSVITKADKIIVHGIFNKLITTSLLIMGKAPMCYWCIWGGDLYSHSREKGIWRSVKERFIRKLSGIITQVYGDYLLACKEYGTSCRYYHCLMYSSNVLTLPTDDAHSFHGDDKINVLCGHYASPSAEHMKIVKQLRRNDKVYFYIPLTYGDREYAKRLEKRIVDDSYLSKRTYCYFDYLEYEDYLDILDQIDVAVFAYHRQQGCGNIIQLIGRGATLYIRPDVSTWEWLKGMGVHVKSIEDLYAGSFEMLTRKESEENKRIMVEYASYDNLVSQWREVLE